MEDYTKSRDRGYATWGKYFHSEEEFEYFWMLPLDLDQRLRLVGILIKERERMDAIVRCTGVSVSSPDHRALCIECCVSHRPPEAVPYY